MRRGLIVLMLLALAAPAMAAVPQGDLLEGVRPGPDGKIDVLTVFAHQDDESIYGGGALLKMKRDPRVRLHILCMTLGDLSSAKDVLRISPDHQGRIRVKELETAAAVYQAEEVIQFDYHDQGLAAADQEALVQEVLQAIERTGAEIVITHDPTGITGHTDHRTTSRVATEAFKQSPAQRLYYTTVAPSSYGLYALFRPSESKERPQPATIRVDISSVRKLKKMAMYAHTTQKQFSDVGLAMDAVGLLRYEYFILAAQNP